MDLNCKYNFFSCKKGTETNYASILFVDKILTGIDYVFLFSFRLEGYCSSKRKKQDPILEVGDRLQLYGDRLNAYFETRDGSKVRGLFCFIFDVFRRCPLDDLKPLYYVTETNPVLEVSCFVKTNVDFHYLPVYDGINKTRIPASCSGFSLSLSNRKKLEMIDIASSNPYFIYDKANHVIVDKVNNSVAVGFDESHIPDYVSSVGKSAFIECDDFDSLIIPNNITKIDNKAFLFCHNLKSVSIPNSVEEIGAQAFNECDIRSVIIPSSVLSIGNKAFQMHNPSEEIVVDEDNPVYDSRYNCNAIIETKTNKIIQACKSTEIPFDIECIGNSAFEHNDSIQSIELNANVTVIEDNAFRCCPNLKSILLPNTIKSIGKYAFFNCHSLETIRIPFGIKRIESYTFGSCYSATDVSIPETITYIGNSAFFNCGSLVTITIPPYVEYIGNNAFDMCENLRYIFFPESVTFIGSDVFRRCPKLEGIVVPKGSSQRFAKFFDEGTKAYIMEK